MKPVYGESIQAKPLPMPTIPTKPLLQAQREMRLTHSLVGTILNSNAGKKTSPEFRRVLNQKYGVNTTIPVKPSIFNPQANGVLYKETVAMKLNNMNPKLGAIFQAEMKKVEAQINGKGNMQIASFFGQKVAQLALDGMAKNGALNTTQLNMLKKTTNADLALFSLLKTNFLKQPGNSFFPASSLYKFQGIKGY